MTQVDNIEVVADATMQASFTNNTNEQIMWTPQSSYSKTDKIASTTSDTWSRKSSFGTSIKFETAVKLLGVETKMTNEFKAEAAFEKGGSKTQYQESSETITVGSGGRFPVPPGETLTVQDIYGKTTTTLLIPGRSMFFGDYRYYSWGGYTPDAPLHKSHLEHWVNDFLKKWPTRKYSLDIGRSDRLAGDRIYKAFSSPSGKMVLPTKAELDFVASNPNVWGAFQDKYEQYNGLHDGHSIGIIEGGLTTKLEVNTGVVSNLYSSEPVMAKNKTSLRSNNSIYTQQGYDSKYNVPIIKWNRSDRLVKNRIARGMSFSPNLSGSITLTEHNDLFNGGDGKDVVYPLGGSDIIHLGGGDDVIISAASGDTSDNSLDIDIFYGEEGDDNITQNNITSHTTFYGGDGNDTLESKALKSAMVGGRGLDTFILHDSVEQASIRDEDPEQGLLINLFCKNDEAINIIRASDGENIIIYFKSADKIRKVSLLDIIGSGGVNISFRNKESNTPDWLVSETELLTLVDEEKGSFTCNSQH